MAPALRTQRCLLVRYPLPRSSGVAHHAIGLLVPFIWSAMLARCSKLVIGGQAVSKRMLYPALDAREQGAIGAVIDALALDHRKTDPC